MGVHTPAPGWYPDPDGTGIQRYWNGIAWTDHKFAPAPRPPELPKKQKWLFLGLVIAGILVLAVVETMMKGSDTEYTDVSGNVPGTGGTHADTTAVGTGVPVRDGQFEFVVRAVSNQRGYVTVSMSVTNIGDEAQTFFPQNQKLIDTAGRTFRADTMAAYDFNKDGIVELSPGLRTQIVVPFKAPPGTQFTAVELHESTFSGGATVSLG
jgi:hypothetical protein